MMEKKWEQWLSPEECAKTGWKEGHGKLQRSEVMGYIDLCTPQNSENVHAFKCLKALP